MSSSHLRTRSLTLRTPPLTALTTRSLTVFAAPRSHFATPLTPALRSCWIFVLTQVVFSRIQRLAVCFIRLMRSFAARARSRVRWTALSRNCVALALRARTTSRTRDRPSEAALMPRPTAPVMRSKTLRIGPGSAPASLPIRPRALDAALRAASPMPLAICDARSPSLPSSRPAPFARPFARPSTPRANAPALPSTFLAADPMPLSSVEPKRLSPLARAGSWRPYLLHSARPPLAIHLTPFLMAPFAPRPTAFTTSPTPGMMPIPVQHEVKPVAGPRPAVLVQLLDVGDEIADVGDLPGVGHEPDRDLPDRVPDRRVLLEVAEDRALDDLALHVDAVQREVLDRARDPVDLLSGPRLDLRARAPACRQRSRRRAGGAPRRSRRHTDRAERRRAS